MCDQDDAAEALDALRDERRSALDSVMPALYRELRALAQRCMASERADHTLQPTALVHEAYLRLIAQHDVDWSSRAQVLGLAARMMRRILVNYAEARNCGKRKGGLRVSLDEHLERVEAGGLDIVPLDAALNSLEQLDPRQARIVELRFFSGLSVEETAQALGISPATVKREWRTARMWLLRELERGAP